MSRRGRSGWRGVRRRLGFEANPLQRDSDRFQAKVRLVLFVFMLLGCLVGAFLGHASYEQEVARSAADVGRGYEATAQVRSVDVATADPQSGATQRVVNLTWRDKADRAQRQRVVVPERQHVGATMQIWVDADGRASRQQPPQSRAVAAGMGAALFTVLFTVIILLGVYGAVAFVLDRRRLAAWGRQWAVVEPHWRRQVL